MTKLNRRRPKATIRLKMERNRLPASTLTELLILMIVSGVVFIGFMDGMELFRRVTGLLTRKISDNSVFYEQYGRLYGLILRADSLAETRDGIRVYRDGRAYADLHRSDSTLILSAEGLTDTLFTGISELETNVPPKCGTADSLYITIHISGNTPLRIAFGCSENGQAMSEALRAKEKNYRYDTP